jgi:alkaline phosphatase
MATGLVATYEVTNATPASFIAHQIKRSMEVEIAADYLKTDIDVIIGGGKRYFEPHIQNLTNNGYQVKYSLEEAEKVTSGKLAAFLAEKHMPTMNAGRGDMLPKSVETAIRILDKNSKGFFIMIEGSQIDGQCHANNIEGEIAEAVDFDNAVKAALDFAVLDGNTLVIVTADHETGGLTLTGGGIDSGEVKAEFSTGGHTSVMVPVFAYGPGAVHFTGVYENTAIFYKMKSLLKL